MINHSGATVQLGQVAAAVGSVWCRSLQPAPCTAIALFSDEPSPTGLTLIESDAL
jgi:hypothetical protein